MVCRALGEAHALGLVHRDIKPKNVIVCERGREGDVAKVVDFGLVMDLKTDKAGVSRQNAKLEGTPLYIAPESIASPADVNARSDLYSLGARRLLPARGRATLQRVEHRRGLRGSLAHASASSLRAEPRRLPRARQIGRAHV